jgi:hypothetical protein
MVVRAESVIVFPGDINIQQVMVYGRILYNSIKEYTPKWFPTIPYSQTTKPVFGTHAAI